MYALNAIPQPDETGRVPGIMVSLSWNHPNAIDFCRSKQTKQLANRLYNMNISLLVPRHEWCEFVSSPVFTMAVESAHATGDPGILIQDRDETSKTTSPCGELWLQQGEVCNLGNINLNHYCQKSKLLKEKMYDDVYQALVLMESVRHHLIYPFEWMKDMSESKGRLGLGVMGFADMCKRLCISYGSPPCIALIHTLGEIMAKAAHAFKQDHPLETRIDKNVNRQVLTLAPTGGTSSLV